MPSMLESSPDGPPPTAADLAFRFRSGRPSLDLAATLGGRYQTPIERLRVPHDLGRWLCMAGVLPTQPAANPSDLLAARELREAIYRVAHQIIGGRPLDPTDTETLNRHAATPPPVPALRSARGSGGRSVGGRIAWSAPDAAAAALSCVARDAIELFGGPHADRVSECARPGCSLLFVDTSRSGDRRWCAMRSCGNLEKVRRHRRRQYEM